MKDKWKLYRCIYDYDGHNDIEGDTATNENFHRRLGGFEDGCDYIIGTAIKLENGDTIIRVELEGKKENLDLVLEMLGEWQ